MFFCVVDLACQKFCFSSLPYISTTRGKFKNFLWISWREICGKWIFIFIAEYQCLLTLRIYRDLEFGLALPKKGKHFNQVHFTLSFRVTGILKDSVEGISCLTKCERNPVGRHLLTFSLRCQHWAELESHLPSAPMLPLQKANSEI